MAVLTPKSGIIVISKKLKHFQEIDNGFSFHRIFQKEGSRNIFRTQSSIYDGGFWQKWLTAKSRQLFLKKSTIIAVDWILNLSLGKILHSLP